ncbi:hypothetical protein D9M68_193540 [compost metagenome]
MADPFDWAELQRLAQNVAAAHISMVAFLEEASVPWSDDQTLEFERIAAAQLAALNEYTEFLRPGWTRSQEPSPMLRIVSLGVG